jgi:hypothetical protein
VSHSKEFARGRLVQNREKRGAKAPRVEGARFCPGWSLVLPSG